MRKRLRRSVETFDGTAAPTINGTVTCGVSNATLVDSMAGNVTVTGDGDFARVHEGRAEGLITSGSFSNCNSWLSLGLASQEAISINGNQTDNSAADA